VAENVARMKRSAIRECDVPFFPDSVALHPGYNTNRAIGRGKFALRDPVKSRPYNRIPQC